MLPVHARVSDASLTVDLTYLVTEFGRPFSIAGFGNKMRGWCDEVDLQHCSAYGLRKAEATIAAENGATEKQLWPSSAGRQARRGRYTRAANRKKMAGDAMGF